MREQTDDGYALDDDPARLDRDAVWAFLSTEAYWGTWRSRGDLEAQIDGAWRVVGCYDPQGALVGFARAVSDGVALAYLADVFVLPPHRGSGRGRRLVAFMVDRGPGARFRWLLHTRDAHGLYAGFGFRPADERVLERPAAQESRPGG